MPDPRPDQYERAVQKLISSFALFCAVILRIYDADSNLVAFAPNKYQVALYRLVAMGIRSFQIHKSRQLGYSTAVACYLFFLALFTPRYRVLVVANTYKNTRGLWEIYDRFVTHMPQWIKTYLDVESVEGLIRFGHGGYIRFYTAGSDAARGQNYQAGHFSEVAFWPDPDRTYAACMGSLSGSDPLLFLESTANGMNVWHDEWANNPIHEKVFSTWVDDRSLDVPVKEREHYDRMAIPTHVAEIHKVRNLSDGQLRWARKKYYGHCRGNRLMFRQEFPTTAKEAFVASGDRVFEQYFANVQWAEGEIYYEEPIDYTPYIVGADPAGGGVDGDFSAMCVLNVSNPTAPTIAYTYYRHTAPIAFARDIVRIARAYSALAVVERNNHGTAALEYMADHQKGYSLYRQERYSEAGIIITDKYGFYTTESSRGILWGEIIDVLGRGRTPIIDPRLQVEMNKCIWKGGKPQADEGAHDDMLTAYGMALMGLGQVGRDFVQEKVFAKLPVGLDAVVRWQSATGLRVADHQHKFREQPGAYRIPQERENWWDGGAPDRVIGI